MNNMVSQAQILIPHCTYEAYAEACGVTVRIVEGWVLKGYVPSIRLGKYTFINLAKLTEELTNK